MEIGSAIALCGVAASIGAVVITAIRAAGQSEECKKEICPQHSGVLAGLDAVIRSQERQEKLLTDMNSEIRQIFKAYKE